MPSTSSNPIAQAEALIASGEPHRAVAILQHALASGRGGLMTRLALGRAFLVAGNIDAALNELRAAAALAPGIADTALALGQALMAAGHLPAAVAEFERAGRLDPDFAAARHALGLAWLEAGEPDRAIEILAGLSATPFASDAAEKIAQARAMKQAHRSPPGYVRHLFDQFSSDYDSRMLGALNYRAHLILRELADLVLIERLERFRPKWLPVRRKKTQQIKNQERVPDFMKSGRALGLDILDLGCGTGLTGAVFADMARRLEGIDLSPRMIEQAKARGVYDDLMIADLETALSQKGPCYDLILAADTLVYLGDLCPTFRGAAERLKPLGFLLFTVERNDHEGAYELGPKRRYRHGEGYLRREAARFGLDVMALLHCTPRFDAEKPVKGLAVALQSPRA